MDDQLLNGFLRIANHGPARRYQYVRLPLRDLPQARNYVSGAGCIAVIAIFFGLGNGILQAEEIEDAAIAVNEIAYASNAFPVRSEEIGDGAARVAGRVTNFNIEIVPRNVIPAVHTSARTNRRHQNPRTLIRVVVELRVLRPECRDASEQRLFKHRINRLRALVNHPASGPCHVAPVMRKQHLVDVDRFLSRIAIDRQHLAAAGDDHAVNRAVYHRDARRNLFGRDSFRRMREGRCESNHQPEATSALSPAGQALAAASLLCDVVF